MDILNILKLALGEMLSPTTITFVLCALGLAVHFGFTGLLNFGQAAFAAVGAYGMVISIDTLKLPLFLAVLMGLLCSIIFALILGIPTLRLRADYLAIVTIATAEVFRYFMTTIGFSKVTGGSNGLSQFGAEFWALNPIPEGNYNFGFVSYRADQLYVLMVGWGAVIIGALILRLLMRSPWGRVIKAIREDEDAVRSLGKNVYLYKMHSLIIGGVIGSIGGFVYALSRQSVQPDNYGTALTFFAYTVLILGGAARVFSPIVGAMIFWFLIVFIEQILRQAVTNNLVPDWLIGVNQVGQIRFMLMGIGLMLLMIFRPQGIFGDKKELALDAKA